MSAAHMPSQGASKSGFAVAVAFLGLALGYPSIYGATVTTFILPLVKEFGWGRTTPSLMFLATTLGVATACLWLGKIVVRFGETRVVLVTGLIMSAAIASLAALDGNQAVAVATCFVIGLAGAANNVGVYLALLPKWFDATLGRALAIAVVGMSVGMTTMPFISATVIAEHGWRTGYLAMAGISLVSVLLMTALLSQLKPPAQRIATGERKTEIGVDSKAALRDPIFWLLTAAFFFLSAGVFGATVHIVPIYTEKGMAAASIALVPVAMGLGTLLGRIVSGILLDRIPTPLIAFATGTIGAASMLALAFGAVTEVGYAAYLPALMIGAAMGAESDILAFATRRYFGMKDYGAIYNRLLISYFVGGLSGPMLVGVLQDKLGGSEGALVVLAILCLLFGLLGLAFGKYRYGEKA